MPKASLNPAATNNDRLTPALQHFLNNCIVDHGTNSGGAPADYIPELAKANPNHFGLALATIDGHVYTAGDGDVEFTIQSISKAFVFALALELLGPEAVEAKIGVEPSGEAFNSIRLSADNRPFNPMVNAGAIACTGLIHGVRGDDTFDWLLNAMSRFAGRKLDFDENVFASERQTGDRNRAIGFMLRNYGVVQGDVTSILDAYFKQCSILVTARDLAIMAATLANNGVNPITKEQIVSPYGVARTLSVMTSTGMYDYAGEWVYRVGIPAKSGVGGGIIAALPAQFGLGTFSPLLDSHGNSVRGIKVCEDISSFFELHVLKRSSDVRTSIIADYDLKGISSRRGRLPREQAILDNYYRDIRVIELVGTLGFANADFVTRQFASGLRPTFLVIDLRRVPGATEGAARLMARMAADLVSVGATLVFSGAEKSSRLWETISAVIKVTSGVRRFDLLDEAIEWVEDQVIYRRGDFRDLAEVIPISHQSLLKDLPPADCRELESLCTSRSFHSGERIIAAGEAAKSIFFVLSGMVSVKLPSGVRLATLSQGMAFGEMALIETVRSADVWADTKVNALELSIAQFEAFSSRHAPSGQRIAHNLAALLAKRLIQANLKVDILSAY